MSRWFYRGRLAVLFSFLPHLQLSDVSANVVRQRLVSRAPHGHAIVLALFKKPGGVDLAQPQDLVHDHLEKLEQRPHQRPRVLHRSSHAGSVRRARSLTAWRRVAMVEPRGESDAKNEKKKQEYPIDAFARMRAQRKTPCSPRASKRRARARHLADLVVVAKVGPRDFRGRGRHSTGRAQSFERFAYTAVNRVLRSQGKVMGGTRWDAESRFLKVKELRVWDEIVRE